MNYYEIVKNGYIVRIEDNRESAVDGFYDPAEFWMSEGVLFVWCPEIGIIKSTISVEEFNDNVTTFLSEGLDVVIKSKNDFVRERKP
jgi:hypothetical protein